MANIYKVCVIDEAAKKQQCVEIETNGVPMGVLASVVSAVLSVVAHVFGVGAKSRALE